MFSALRKGLVYTNISQDIVEHDVDIDVDQWFYDQKDVYRGSIDPEYLSHKLHVHWLYNDDSQRVGLAEHDADDPAIFKALWFYENPYATLLQDPEWKSTNETLWSKLSNEAYQDVLENDCKDVSDLCLQSGRLLITPSMLIDPPTLFTCELCSKKTLTKSKSCSIASASSLDFSKLSVLFLDDDFVIYSKSSLEVQPPHDACEQEPLVQQVPLAGLEESKDALQDPESESQAVSEQLEPHHLPQQ
jgi:hypothetical protein